MKLQKFTAYFVSITLLAFIVIYFGLIYYFFKGSFENINEVKLHDLGTFLGGVTTPLVFMILFFQYLKSQDEALERIKKENADKEEKERMAQPLFDFKSSALYYFEDHEHNEACYSLIFEISNSLADATDVYIKASLEETKSKHFMSGVRSVFRGESKEIIINIDINEIIDFENFNIFKDFEIELTFYDSLRLFKNKALLCKIEDTNPSADYSGGQTELKYNLSVCETNNGH